MAVGAAAPDPVLVVGRAKSGSFDLKAFLPEVLARAKGKGGGSPDLAQVAGESPEAIEEAWRWAAAALAEQIG